MSAALVLEEQIRSPKLVEQSVSMMQQLATAQIQSRYAIALKYPRDVDAVREAMLRECSRPEFVMPDENKNGSSVAWYKLPKGNGVEGFTIRFAEMARQHWGHTFVDVIPIGEDESQRIFQVSCTDYQTNNGGSEIVTVAKSVERSYTKDTDTVISQRTNSKGKPVFLIIGTDDEVSAKRNALNSKARRNLILELIPGWLKEECKKKMLETARNKDAQDPDAAKRKLYDAFSSVGVTATQLTDYLGHSNSLSPAELEELRGFYSGIREGYTTWREILASKEDSAEETDTLAKLDALLTASGRTPAQVRKMRGQYAGRPKDLIAYLEDEAAKKADTGAQPQQQSQPTTQEATKEADTKPSTNASSTGTTAAASTSQESKPEPAKEQPRQSLLPAVNMDADW